MFSFPGNDFKQVICLFGRTQTKPPTKDIHTWSFGTTFKNRVSSSESLNNISVLYNARSNVKKGREKKIEMLTDRSGIGIAQERVFTSYLFFTLSFSHQNMKKLYFSFSEKSLLKFDCGKKVFRSYQNNNT